MGLSSVIIGRRAEQHSEDIIHVLAVKMEVLGSRFNMGALIGCDIKEFNSVNLFDNP